MYDNVESAEAEDADGDGRTVLQGDCWDSLIDPVPPEGALDHGVTALDIYEGAEDLPYDGIDANCDGKNDFDADDDGFVPDEYAGFPTQGVGLSDFPAGDCWDLEEENASPSGEWSAADVNPDATEVWYDGTDSDCSGDDDCDQDGDGFLVQENYCEQIIGDNAVDCNDVNPDIFPNDEPEIYYNATDDNCDWADGDGDKDGDGYWDVNYPFLENEVDISVQYPDSLNDCWDDDFTNALDHLSPEAGGIYQNCH